MKYNKFELSAKEKIVGYILNSEGRKYYGELELHPNKFPIFSLESSDIEYSKLFLKDICSEKIIFKSNTKTFLLCDNEIEHSQIYSRFLIKSEGTDILNTEFKEIGVYNEFFSQMFYEYEVEYSRKNYTFSRKVDFYSFETSIDFNGKSITLYNCYNQSTVNKDGKVIIEEYPTINIKSNSGNFNLTEIENLIHDISLLFTFLVGLPIIPELVWVLENKTWLGFYFPRIEPSKKIEYSRLFSLIDIKKLLKENSFTDIIHNYFHHKKYSVFKDKWSKIYSLLDYNGIWDYEFIGFVSLLDHHVSNFASKNRPKRSISKNYFKKLKTKLNDIIEKEPLESEEIKKVLRDQINSLKISSLGTFNENFEFLLNSVDKNLIDIIDLSKEDFKVIKKLRDDIAHSNTINYEEIDYTKINILKNKITILLFYFILLDLGIKHDAFLESMANSYNQIIRNSNLNELLLDRLSKKFPFIKITDSEFKKIKENKLSLVILELKKKYKLNFEYSVSAYDNWNISSGPENYDLRKVIQKMYHEDAQVEFCSIGYVETDDMQSQIKIDYLCLISIK
ncbi:hypothetical protein EHQ30_05135 [Leptospira brenneri]|uniref:ApeA N-terminal domain-containing protein n=1 Tax=Leptospira brenneri TaxID=2023182 RepID=A0A5F1ZAX7_9LEPT|nr:HEPN domain-containing protein [Leptospira brenneri]TGK96013.1 hypothetical protein EHQ30_05135 [Leptospira brenneri]